MSSPLARVQRDGHVVEVDPVKSWCQEISSSWKLGDVVPADMRLLEVLLKIEEAALTGESVPVEKDLSIEV